MDADSFLSWLFFDDVIASALCARKTYCRQQNVCAEGLPSLDRDTRSTPPARIAQRYKDMPLARFKCDQFEFGGRHKFEQHTARDQDSSFLRGAILERSSLSGNR